VPLATRPEDSVTPTTFLIDGVSVPRFLYGTAWKEDETRRLTELALRQGFRGIDTANQRKHYHEAAVGEAIAGGNVPREDLFLQSKFTFRPGQDHRLPYDPRAPIASQVEQSFASSLQHLGTDYLDSFVLHGPMTRVGLSEADWEAWRAMEDLHVRVRARLLGISNVDLDQLYLLCQGARVRPHFVQNRCFAVHAWDRDVRAFCAEHDIVYQGFSLLTANRPVLARREVAQIAARHGRTVAQVVFRFALEVGMLPLTGTSDPCHMREDLDVFNFDLDSGEVEVIEALS
jgi:diketogulonate reductase-like aldo/keto reductase